MPADIGEMFYTGETPWHGLGLALGHPATLKEALRAGGLDWEVEQVELMTGEDPPSPVPKRRAIVRKDRSPGHDDRVLAHRGFRPLQNRDGAMLFDAIFGHGQRVYHTGGYLGSGEVIWLLAKIDKTLEIGHGDVVEPYALFANSHDGSMAISIRLTTVRVVCRNTLALSMSQRGLGPVFRRAHQGNLRDHAEAARGFFAATLEELDHVAGTFTSLSKIRCPKPTFLEILQRLLPEPKKPRNAERNPGLLKAWEARIQEVQLARKKILQLTEDGQGMNLEGAKGTFWGALNAVLEYVDHHQGDKKSRLPSALLGEGMDLKRRAFKYIEEAARLAA